ncbi:MAG: ABC transporter ATP-binding protein [Ignavibacteriae bacterium]|nr:ABC transporter ATP-binding protein [Ignavibacteriota bacterium]MCB9243926.1 ABC transporter ATP-binding protein [Ignavibacteriales bacterium]
MIAIQSQNVSKSFDGKTLVLDDINFEVPQGEVVGFLGPNGAGKTTTVRLLNGVLSPDKGKMFILGEEVDPEKPDIHRECGVMTDTAHCYEDLTGTENLVFFGQLYGMSKNEALDRANHAMKLFEIFDSKDRKLKEYSTGMKKRLSLARASIHNPKILFLDEPTSGLDPEAAKKVNLHIKEIASEEKVTVFLCTHQLKYAEEICTSYGFIDKGKILGFGTFDELLSKKDQSVILDIRGENIPPIYRSEFSDGRSSRIKIKTDTEANDIISSILQNGGKIYEAKQTGWDLEDLYFAYQKGDNN